MRVSSHSVPEFLIAGTIPDYELVECEVELFCVQPHEMKTQNLDDSSDSTPTLYRYQFGSVF